MTDQRRENLAVRLLDTAVHYMSREHAALADGDHEEAAFYGRQYQQAMTGYHSLTDGEEVTA